ASCHGVARVEADIEDSQVQLRAIDLHRPKIAREIELDRDVLAQRMRHHIRDVDHCGAQVENLWIQQLPAREGEELSRQSRASICSLQNELKPPGRGVR